jgi:hypothetical protein
MKDFPSGSGPAVAAVKFGASVRRCGFGDAPIPVAVDFGPARHTGYRVEVPLGGGVGFAEGGGERFGALPVVGGDQEVTGGRRLVSSGVHLAVAVHRRIAFWWSRLVRADAGPLQSASVAGSAKPCGDRIVRGPFVPAGTHLDLGVAVVVRASGWPVERCSHRIEHGDDLLSLPECRRGSRRRGTVSEGAVLRDGSSQCSSTVKSIAKVLFFSAATSTTVCNSRGFSAPRAAGWDEIVEPEEIRALHTSED